MRIEKQRPCYSHCLIQFEERAYGADNWVCTKQLITDISGEDGMFMKLFEYITGANDASKNGK